MAIQQVYRREPENKGVICGVLMHLIRSIDSTPTDVPAHVRESLSALKMRQVVSRFGMMFIHDLDLSPNSETTLPGVRPCDDRDVLSQLELSSKNRKRKRIFQDNSRSIEFPLGKRPTWNQVKDIMKKNPLLIIRHWTPSLFYSHRGTTAGILFVKFTRGFWVLLKTEHIIPPEVEEEVENLDQAMAIWSASNVSISIKNSVFILNRSGVNGAVPGGNESRSFRERSIIYFPSPGILPPSGSKWFPFFNAKVGYIHEYHKSLDLLQEDEEKDGLKESIGDLFNEIQCLPESEGFTSRKEGRTWPRAKGEDGIAIIVNSRHMKFMSIGSVRQVNTGPSRPHVTRPNTEVLSELYRKEGLVAQGLQREMRRWKEKKKRVDAHRSVKTKNARRPPQRKLDTRG